MIAVKLKGTVTKDHRLELTLPPSVPSGEVEVIVLHPEPPPSVPCPGGTHNPLRSILPPACGRIVRIWATPSPSCRSFASVWKPDTMSPHDRLIETTILVDLPRGQAAAIT
jgi:hypothetical protein